MSSLHKIRCIYLDESLLAQPYIEVFTSYVNTLHKGVFVNTQKKRNDIAKEYENLLISDFLLNEVDHIAYQEDQQSKNRKPGQCLVIHTSKEVIEAARNLQFHTIYIGNSKNIGNENYKNIAEFIETYTRTNKRNRMITTFFMFVVFLSVFSLTFPSILNSPLFKLSLMLLSIGIIGSFYFAKELRGKLLFSLLDII